MLYSIVGIIAVIIDQIVKYWVSKNLFGTDIVKFIPKVISLVNVQNDGAAFSFLSGANARIPFIIVTVIFLILVILALATDFISGPLSRWCLVMIGAGGLGNCIDRIVNGYVQDMFKVELFNFPVFNVADIYITVFALIFVFAMIFERQPEVEEDEDDDIPEVKPEKRRRVKEKAVRYEEPKSLLGRRKGQKEDEDDFYFGDEPAPARKPSQRSAETAPAETAARKPAPKKVSYEEEYARYKAQREARGKTAPKAAPVQPVNSDDPFAEWERMTQPAAAPAEAAETPAPAVKPEYTAPKKQTAPAKAVKSEDSFSLDDILAEFK